MGLFIAKKFVEASLPLRRNPIPVNQCLATGSPRKAEVIELCDKASRKLPVLPLSPHPVDEAAKLWVLRIVKWYVTMTMLQPIDSPGSKLKSAATVYPLFVQRLAEPGIEIWTPSSNLGESKRRESSAPQVIDYQWDALKL
jgi:hypothetical protein